MPPSIPASVPTLTNPLNLYRSLLATKQIYPDPSQHRLAIHLQKLYFRLLDYSPQEVYGSRLKTILQTIDKSQKIENDSQVAVPGHPLRRNPLFAHLFSKKEQRDTLALTRVLTSYEEAMNLQSPQGLLLHGEVGTGKSMLIDLLADGLPNWRKKRWHFNTFMLEVLSKLEHLRRIRSQSRQNQLDTEHSLLWLAKDMIEKSPILFLDEFQLPDRAASKIISQLLTAFFQLGGVLIATSNRMPDELSKASGVEFTTPTRRGVIGGILGIVRKEKMSIFPSSNEYAGFMEVLKARCEIWNMDASRDWRRREAEEVEVEARDAAETIQQYKLHGIPVPDLGLSANDVNQPGSTSDKNKLSSSAFPKKYVLAIPDKDEAWQHIIAGLFSSNVTNPINWKSTTLTVYGRQVQVPRHLHGVTYWSFHDLCGHFFGPADYITLASTFHTLVLDKVPIMTLAQKNEARRLITLLDALYEVRCKLVMRAEAGPDDLFFPETKVTAEDKDLRRETDVGDAVYSETIAEIYQDQTSPFRPNVSSYTDEAKSIYDPDEDSDFGPLHGKGNEIGRQVDFGMTSSFTGEDERFAYKRATSRLWEMCSARWHARSEAGWWRPLPVEARRWERSCSVLQSAPLVPSAKGDVKLGDYVELDIPAGLQGRKFEKMEVERLRKGDHD